MKLVTKIILTLAIGAAVFLLQKVLQRAIDRYIRKRELDNKRGLAVHKVKSILLYFIGAVFVIYVWGIDLENVWVFLTGFLGLVAIGFFAVWSILSNIFAGIKGTVKDINLFFITLIDEEGNHLQIPSNLVFQKIVKKIQL